MVTEPLSPIRLEPTHVEEKQEEDDEEESVPPYSGAGAGADKDDEEMLVSILMLITLPWWSFTMMFSWIRWTAEDGGAETTKPPPLSLSSAVLTGTSSSFPLLPMASS